MKPVHGGSQARRGGRRGARPGGPATIVGKVCVSLFLLFWMAAPACDLFALLRGGSLAEARGAPVSWLFVAVSAFFPLAGIAGLVAVWRRPRRPAMPPFQQGGPSDGEGEPEAAPAVAPDYPGMPAGRKVSVGDFIPPLFGAVFLAAGLAIGYVGSQAIRRHHAVDWRETSGTVLSSEADRDSSGRYVPRVVYCYEVGGCVYTNDVLSPSTPSTSDVRPAVNRAARYRPGDGTTVRYNAADPSESELEGYGLFAYVMLLFPLPFVIAGGAMFFMGLKNLLSSRAPVAFDTALTGVRLRRVGGQDGEKAAFAVVWCLFSFFMAFVWYTASGPFSWTRAYWTFDKFLALLFPLVGIGFVASSLRTAVRRARTGRFSVEIASGGLRPGARVQATYSFSGDAERLDRVVFSVERRNVAFGTAPSDGGDPYAWRGDVVWTIDDPPRALNGSFAFTVPPAVEGRRLQWRLVVKYAGLTDAFKLDVVSE